MSGEWRLTAASLKSMKRCCSLAGPKDVRNKWLAEFKETQCYTEFGKTLYRLLRHTSDSLDAKEDAEVMKTEVKRLETTYEEFFDGIEAEPVARFDAMLEEGARNTILFNILAERLSSKAVEQICVRMFETMELNALYVQSFFRYFLPVYLKRPYTWFSLDILVKAKKFQPVAFRILLQILLKDPEISNTMINDFVATLDDLGKSEFLTLVMDSELTHREFAHNLISIHSVYNGMEKTECLQQYIFNCLSRYATFCTSDWNYGRLLLAYIQASGTELNFLETERLVEMHRSPFKRTCMAALNELVERLNAQMLPPNPS